MQKTYADEFAVQYLSELATSYLETESADKNVNVPDLVRELLRVAVDAGIVVVTPPTAPLC